MGELKQDTCTPRVLDTDNKVKQRSIVPAAPASRMRTKGMIARATFLDDVNKPMLLE